MTKLVQEVERKRLIEMRQFNSERLAKLNRDVKDPLDDNDDDEYVSTKGEKEYIQAMTSIV